MPVQPYDSVCELEVMDTSGREFTFGWHETRVISVTSRHRSYPDTWFSFRVVFDIQSYFFNGHDSTCFVVFELNDKLAPEFEVGSFPSYLGLLCCTGAGAAGYRTSSRLALITHCIRLSIVQWRSMQSDAPSLICLHWWHRVDCCKQIKKLLFLY